MMWIPDFGLVDKLIESVGDRPLQVAQVVSVGTGFVAASLYLYRWYDLNFNILNEYSYIDYNKNVVPQSDLEKLATVDTKDVESISKLVRLSQGQIVAVWSPDVFRAEVLVDSALRKAQCRVIHLDFSNVVWAESIPSWIRRIYETSNRLRSTLQQIFALIRDGAPGQEEDTEMCDEHFDKMLVEFRTLMAEKRHWSVRTLKEDPSRPLVMYIKGIDSLLGMASKYGARGHKVISVYLAHFCSYLRHPRMHVVLAMSDQFWLQHWIRNNGLRSQGLSFHAREPVQADLMRAWGEHLAGRDAGQEAQLRYVLQTWGSRAPDVARVVAALDSGLVRNAQALAQADLTAIVAAWIQRYQCVLRCDRAEEQDEDEDQGQNATSSGGRSGQLVGLIRLLAESPDGSVAVSGLMDRGLLQCAIDVMLEAPDSLITLHADDDRTGGCGGTTADQEDLTLQGIQDQDQELECDLFSLGLYFRIRRPIEHRGLRQINNLLQSIEQS